MQQTMLSVREEIFSTSLARPRSFWDSLSKLQGESVMLSERDTVTRSAIVGVGGGVGDFLAKAGDKAAALRQCSDRVTNIAAQLNAATSSAKDYADELKDAFGDDSDLDSDQKSLSAAEVSACGLSYLLMLLLVRGLAQIHYWRRRENA